MLEHVEGKYIQKNIHRIMGTLEQAEGQLYAEKHSYYNRHT